MPILLFLKFFFCEKLNVCKLSDTSASNFTIKISNFKYQYCKHKCFSLLHWQRFVYRNSTELFQTTPKLFKKVIDTPQFWALWLTLASKSAATPRNKCKLFFLLLIVLCESLGGQTVHFVHCKRIPQQGRSLCSSFVLYFPLIVPTKFPRVERLVSGIQEYTDTKLCSYPVHMLASWW